MSKKKPLSPELKAECDALKGIWLSKKRELRLKNSVIAEKAAISDPAVSLYINGTNALNLRIGTVFSEALGVDLGAFSERLHAERNALVHGVGQSKKGMAENDPDSIMSMLDGLSDESLLDLATSAIALVNSRKV